jgi:hypothetical protein
MTTRATRLRRLELWSGLQCAGGQRLSIWTQVLAASVVLTLGLDSQLTAQVALDEAASIALDRWQVVRVWESDTLWDEWVITDVVRDDTSSVLTFNAGPVTLLFGRSGLVEERTPDGRVRYELDRVGLQPVTLLDTVVLAALAQQGLTWVVRGDVVPTQVRDLSLAWTTPLQALTTLAEVCGAEVQCRRIGTSGYAIDLLERIGADAPDLDVRAARNLLEFSQNEALSEHATVITGRGATVDGESATIAEAVWRVAAIDGAMVTLADVLDGPGPIGWDDQLTGLQLETPEGDTFPIVASSFGDQVITCDAAPTVSVGDVVRLVAADGADLTALPCPPAVRDYGRVMGVLERQDLPGHRNLLPNSVLRDWSGPGTSPPTGWATVGSVTLSRITTGAQVTRGEAALQVITSGSGTGIATPVVTVGATTARPFLSGYVTLWVMGGQVRVELVATTAGGERIYPLGGNLATNSETGVQIPLGLSGINCVEDGITAARLRVVQHSTAPATVVIESAQLTRSVAQLPFVEGSGGSQLWQAVNTALVTAAVPRLRTTVRVLDVARLMPETFAADATITLGATARVVLPRRNIDGTARITRVERDLLAAGTTAFDLSDKPQDLTGSLARATWRARPIPRPPIVVLAGDVTASTAFDAAGALTILVTGPVGSDSLRAAVSTSAMPSAATVDAATGSLRADGTDVAVLTASGPFAEGTIVYVAFRAYKGGIGSRLGAITDSRDAADAAQGPSLSVREEPAAEYVRVRFAAIGTVTYRVNDVLTTVPSSPFDIARPAALTTPGTFVLFSTRNGLTASHPITVNPIGVDTVTPSHELVPESDAQLRDSVAFRYSGADPSGRGLTVTRTMTLTGCSAVGFSGPGPHTLSQGQRVEIIKPLAANAGTARFRTSLAGGGSVEMGRSIPPRDLTGAGVEVLSNPEFRADLPRRAVAYGTLNTLFYGPREGQNSSGQELVIVKDAGTSGAPGSGGFSLALPHTTAAGFVADAFRTAGLYLVTLRALIPVGYWLNFATNAIGTGASAAWVSSNAGTGSYADYVLRLQIGATGSFEDTGYFWITSSSDSAPVTWRCCRINWRDLSASERQPVGSLVARVIDSDATTATVEAVMSPATADTRVWLVGAMDAPSGGAAVDAQVANGSTWVFARRGFRLGAVGARFRGRTPGFEVADAAVEIPEQGRDTISLAMEVEKVGGSATTDVLRIKPTDPIPQGAGTLTLSILLGGAPGASPAGPFAMTSGSPADVTVTRPAQNALDSVVGFTLAGAGRVSAFREITVAAQRTRIPGRIEVLTPVQSGADYTLRWRAALADGGGFGTVSELSARAVRTPGTGGAPSTFALTITYDAINNWFSTTLTRAAGDGYSIVLGILPQGVTALTEVSVSIPSWGVLVPGQIEQLTPTQSPATNHVLRFRAFTGLGVQLTSAADVTAVLVETPDGGTPSASARSVFYDDTNDWHFTDDITRAEGVEYRYDLTIPARGDTARTLVSVPVPRFAAAPGAPGPRFTSVSIEFTGSFSDQVTLSWTEADMPSGVTYEAIASVRSVLRFFEGITNGYALGIGQATDSSSYPVLTRVTGTLYALLDGQRIAERGIPETLVYVPVSET